MENQSRKYLYSHTNPETAYVASDYPSGFRLRTNIRYWIESKVAKNGDNVLGVKQSILKLVNGASLNIRLTPL